MKVIVCGAGQVGYGIAERLAAEKNDVSIIDVVPRLIHGVSDTLDVRGFVGHGSHPDVLEKAGAGEADMIIAVTLYDEVNIVACEVAHTLFDVPMKIARIRSQAYLKSNYINFSRDRSPIDAIISPESQIAELILHRIAFPGVHDIARFIGDKILMLAIECTGHCPILHTPFRELTRRFPDLFSVIVALDRKGVLSIARSADQLKPGDKAYVITKKEDSKRVLSLFGHEEPEANRIIIAGGGNISLSVARALETRRSHVKLKIIENNPERASLIARELHGSVVLNGSALDQKLLSEAEVQEADLIISLTNSDHVNILSAVMAKQMGCLKNLSLINDPAYLDLAKAVGVDAYINPRAVTISRILQHVRRGRIRGVYSIDRGGGEILEAEAFETSPLVRGSLSELNLPSGIRIGVVYRDGEFIKPSGSVQIKPRDRVLIFSLANSVKDVEQLCRVNIDFF